jgi:hypothetical protein
MAEGEGDRSSCVPKTAKHQSNDHRQHTGCNIEQQHIANDPHENQQRNSGKPAGLVGGKFTGIAHRHGRAGESGSSRYEKRSLNDQYENEKQNSANKEYRRHQQRATHRGYPTVESADPELAAQKDSGSDDVNADQNQDDPEEKLEILAQ